MSVLLFVMRATIELGDVVSDEEDEVEDEEEVLCPEERLPIRVEDETVAELGGEPALLALCGDAAPAAMSDAPNWLPTSW